MLKKLIKSLEGPVEANNVFNPWWQIDSDNDIDAQGPKIRRKQLIQYMEERIGISKFLLVGEAIGYQGGHFTGIAMTSERMLLGGLTKRGILPEHIFSGIEAQRTSKPDLKPQGFTEPTGTIVWGHIINSGLNPKDCILWNAFPWHPFKPKIGTLSNRTPTQKEFQTGKSILSQLIRITGVNHVIAVGEKSFSVLNQLGIDAMKVRHPANGGSTLFKKQFDSYIQGL